MKEEEADEEEKEGNALWFNSKFETTRLGPSREGTLSLSLWFAYVYMYSANKVLSAMHVIHIQSRRQQT